MFTNTFDGMASVVIYDILVSMDQSFSVSVCSKAYKLCMDMNLNIIISQCAHTRALSEPKYLSGLLKL